MAEKGEAWLRAWPWLQLAPLRSNRRMASLAGMAWQAGQERLGWLAASGSAPGVMLLGASIVFAALAVIGVALACRIKGYIGQKQGPQHGIRRISMAVARR